VLGEEADGAEALPEEAAKLYPEPPAPPACEDAKVEEGRHAAQRSFEEVVDQGQLEAAAGREVAKHEAHGSNCVGGSPSQDEA
jgi:hypothetical protein